MQHLRRKLPAYGRRLTAMRRAGRVPSTRQVVVVVADWKLANAKREDVLVMPPNEPPSALDWHAVAGLPVLLIVNEHDTEVADAVAAEVIRAGSRGCAALILPSFAGPVGWRLYQSHFPVDHGC